MHQINRAFAALFSLRQKVLMPSYEVEIRLLILPPGKLRRERWIICWRLLRSAGLEVVPCLVSLLPETTNTFKAWLWSCDRKCVVVPGVFAERG